jgi:hypothetical protein
VRAGAGRRAGRIGAGYSLVEGGSGRDLASSYVRHCHILEHENNDMVGTYEVLKQEVTGMARTFSMVTVASPSMLLERARRVASENGVALIGNERSGRFWHKMLRGEYRIIGRTVIVTITYKHRLVPWSVLEGRLRGLFGSSPSGIPPVHQRSTAGAARRSRGRRRASRGPPHHHGHPHRRRPPHRR